MRRSEVLWAVICPDCEDQPVFYNEVGGHCTIYRTRSQAREAAAIIRRIVGTVYRIRVTPVWAYYR